nr:MAG TPA: hypothetical protein [Caudoviricetes sp.]
MWSLIVCKLILQHKTCVYVAKYNKNMIIQVINML